MFKNIFVGTAGTGKTQGVVNFVHKFENDNPLIIEVSRNLITQYPEQAEERMKAINAYASEQQSKGRPVLVVFDEIQNVIGQGAKVLRDSILKGINSANYNIIATTNLAKLFDEPDLAAVASRFGGVTKLRAPEKHKEGFATFQQILQNKLIREKKSGVKYNRRKVKRLLEKAWKRFRDDGAYRRFNEFADLVAQKILDGYDLPEIPERRRKNGETFLNLVSKHKIKNIIT